MTTNKQSFLTYTAAASALACAFAFLLLVSSESHNDQSDPVFSREVVAYEILPAQEGEEAIVKYEYVGDVVPEKLSPTEEVSKRTETAYHSLIAVENEGTKKETRTYEGVFYTRPTFVKQGSEWHYIEHATTTETAFNALRKDNVFASLFWRTAYADSITPFAGAGDGEVRQTGGDTSPVYCNTGGGLGANHTNTTAEARKHDNLIVLGPPGEEEFTYTCNTYRIFLPFDTSSMPGGSTVSAATVSFYVTTKTNGYNDGVDYISVLQTTQASHTALANADFGSFGSTQGTSAPIDIGSITTSAYNTITLNSTGRSWIKGSGASPSCGVTNGITCLGLAEGHDFNGLDMTFSNLTNSIIISTSEQTGTSQDPYLSVTYTVGGNFAFWQFQDF